MRTFAFTLALSFAVLTAVSAPARAREFTHEGWSGYAVVKEGKLVQCYMVLPAITDYDLILGLNPDQELRLAIRSHKLDVFWSMLFQQKFGVRIQLDDGPVLTKAFVAQTATSLSTSLKNTDWEKRLPTADVLRVNAGRIRLFRLNGIKEAMGKLRACVTKRRTA